MKKRNQLLAIAMVAILGIFSLNVVTAQTTTPTKKSAVKSVTQDKKSGATTKPNTAKTTTTPKKSTTGTLSSSKVKTVSNTGIEGYWITAQKGSILQFAKQADGTYTGKVVWVKNTTSTSKVSKNSNKAKSKSSYVGETMIYGLKYNTSTNTYEGGTLKQPGGSSTYSCKIRLQSNNNIMKVIGSKGFLSRTLTWTRTTGIPSK